MNKFFTQQQKLLYSLFLLFVGVVGSTFAQCPGVSVVNLTTLVSYPTIEDAICGASNGQTLQIQPANADCDEFFLDGSGNPTDINGSLACTDKNNLIIDGNGATITNDDGKVNAFFLNNGADPYTFTIKNITLCHFSGTTGSAILGNRGTPDGPGAHYILDNVKVYDSWDGAYAVALQGKATITNCDFSNCVPGSNTGGLSIATNGVVGETYLIENSIFNCNEQIGNGAGIAITHGASGTTDEQEVTIRNCSINNNDGTEVGGLYIDLDEGVLLVDNCTFIGNVSNPSNTNFAPAISNIRNDATTTIQNCTIEANQADGSGSYSAIFIDNNGTVSNNFIRGNSTPIAAAPVFATTITGNYFEGNSTEQTTTGNDIVGLNITDMGDYNYSGVMLGTCPGGCTSAGEASPGAAITLPTCSGGNGVLSSSTTGDWFYQLTDGTVVALGSGTTATIPTGLDGSYIVFWQEISIAEGTDPIVGFTVASVACETLCTDCLNATCEHEVITQQDWGDGLTVTETEMIDTGADTDCEDFTTTTENTVTVCTEFVATGNETGLTVSAEGTGCTGANVSIMYELTTAATVLADCGNANTNIDGTTGDITTDLLAGTTYQYCVTVDYSADASCDIDNVCPVILECTTTPTNDDICNAFDLSGGVLTNQNNICASLENMETIGGADQSVWYEYTVPIGVEAITIATSNNDFNTQVTIYTGTPNCGAIDLSVDLSAVEDGFNDDSVTAVNGESEVSVCLDAGTTYYIQVDGNAAGEDGNFDITVTDATGSVSCACEADNGTLIIGN